MTSISDGIAVNTDIYGNNRAGRTFKSVLFRYIYKIMIFINF